MHKRVYTGLSAVALAATLMAPTMSLAKEKESESHKSMKPRLTSTVAIDGKGDNNGLAKFKKHSENRRLVQVTGKVTAVSATSITIERRSGEEIKNVNGTRVVKPTKSYTFAITGTTSVLRKYKGTATINEVMLGDTVKIWGTKLVGGNALIIWDSSIWYAEVRGVVSNLNATAKAFTLTVTKDKVEYSTTVKFDDATTFLMSDGTAKTAADLANGQTIKVKGAWDSVGKFLFAKRIVIFPATI